LEFQFHPIVDRLHLLSVLKWIHVTAGFEPVLVFGQQIRLKSFLKHPSATTNRAGGMEMALERAGTTSAAGR
jgi:hypothetical protein